MFARRCAIAVPPTNDVTREFDGCALQEHWKGSQRRPRFEFQLVSPGPAPWQQTWVDNRGLTLQLRGAFVAGSMVLSGKRIGANGAQIFDRISWTPLTRGRDRQHWQESADGKRWRDVFDGYYARQ